ncbi:galectin-6-like [Syngnathus scovelli]|uniref:galectin-6-like n=1 Tax=Syngnathus scovelli TaxID=161590 RepID=UPI00210F3E1F|nr:32 kDa beta-galactoside-binding lectin-like [Syngnathus scovelli]
MAERTAAEEYLSPQLNTQTRYVSLLVGLLVVILLVIVILLPVLIFNKNKKPNDYDDSAVIDFSDWGKQLVYVTDDKDDVLLPPSVDGKSHLLGSTKMLNFSEQLALALVNNMAITGKIKSQKVEQYGKIEPTNDKICWFNIFMKPVGVSHIGKLAGGLQVGRQIIIRGRVNQSPNKFMVDLLDNTTNISMRLQPRFNYNGDTKVFVRTAYISGTWGTDERQQQSFPFDANSYFEMVIHCSEKAFNVSVNNAHVLDFNHRLTGLNRTTRVKVEGDIKLMDVRLL